MGKFASNTNVSVEKSRAEIETVLSRYGASHFAYMVGPTSAQIAFATQDRKVRFTLPLPDRGAKEFTRTAHKNQLRSPEAQREAREQACRQRWRALLLAIKAKLEAVDCQISTFEAEFLAFVVDPVTGKTIGEQITPLLTARYADPQSHGPLTLLGLPAPAGEEK